MSKIKMLPAIAYRQELQELFTKVIYDDDYFLYIGYPYGHELPNIGAYDDVFHYVILEEDTSASETDRVIGYMGFHIDTLSDTVDRFGLYSFDKGNPLVGKAVFEKMEELIKDHHRISWRMIGGNPVERSYDRFCKQHGGNIVELHDVTKDKHGNYLGEKIYEIINPNK